MILIHANYMILMIFYYLQAYINLIKMDDKSRKDDQTRDATQLTIEKALQFAGDNSNYQKKRLLFLTIIILSLAILTSKVTMLGSKILLAFLIASGIGQIFCVVYLNILAITLGLLVFTISAAVFYPFSQTLTDLSYLGMAFFARGFLASSLTYINQIGGERFRGWSIIVIFAVWGVSYLVSSVEWMLNWPKWIWFYLLIFLPIIIDAYFIFKHWKPSPYFLYTQKLYPQAKFVLNQIAEENQRPHFPYALQGEGIEDDFLDSKKPTYFQIVHEPILRKITIPLLVIWIFRQYIFYGSYLIIPELSYQYTKNYILISISQTVAVLMSYPIRLKIRRVNAIFGLTAIILIASFICSFGVVDDECKEKGNFCSMKYVYRVSNMMIRFSIALLGNILINYTLEVYPSNVRNMAFTLMITASSLGSIALPCINSAFIHAGFSGFLGFAVAALITVYFSTQLTQTYGKMSVQKLQQLQNKAPLIPLSSWKSISM